MKTTVLKKKKLFSRSLSKFWIIKQFSSFDCEQNFLTVKCKKFSLESKYRRQRGSVVRVGNLNAEDPGSNPRLGLLE